MMNTHKCQNKPENPFQTMTSQKIANIAKLLNSLKLFMTLQGAEADFVPP